VTVNRRSGALHWVTPTLAAYGMACDPRLFVNEPSLALCVKDVERLNLFLKRNNLGRFAYNSIYAVPRYITSN